MVIEDENSRQLCYAKRRNGLLKKALELFCVCGVDCLFISFSASGRLSYFCGDKRVEDILEHLMAVPVEVRNFNITDEEFAELLEMVSYLKEQSMELLRQDPTYVALEAEIARVKGELEAAKTEFTRTYEVVPESIQTIEEAEMHEAFLVEALAKLQARRKQLQEEEGIEDDDQAQPFGDKAATERQPGEGSSMDREQITNQAFGTGSSQVPIMDENPFVADTASPRPQQSGSSWSNFLLLPDTPDTVSPMMEIVHQTPVLSSPPLAQTTERIQSSNQIGNPSDGFVFPTAAPPSPNDQMTLGESGSTGLFNTPQQWANQGTLHPNPTQTRQISNFQEMLDTRSGTGSMYPPDAGLNPPVPERNQQGNGAGDLEDIERSLANIQNTVPPPPGPEENEPYEAVYDKMAVPIDPHLRFSDIISKAAESSKNRENSKP